MALPFHLEQCRVLISTSQFCQIVDIGLDRFEQRRTREQAAADLAEVIEGARAGSMPIAPLQRGKHLRFDAIDAIRLRAAIQLERGGMAFGTACDFIRSAGVTGYLTHQAPSDFFAARWLEPGAVIRHVSGSRQDLGRAMPAAPLAATVINISAIADDVARRAQAQLGLTVRHGHFQESAS